MRDPYDVLGVGRSASEAEVKRAYRKLAKQYHPDRHAGDKKAQAKFAEINAAYEIVGDKEKRGKFDRGEIDAEGKPRSRASRASAAARAAAASRTSTRAPSRTSFPSFGRGGGTAAERAPSASRSGGPGGARRFQGEPRGRRSPLLDLRRLRRPRTGGAPAGAPGADVRADVAVTLEDIAAGRKPKVSLPTGKTVALTLPKGVDRRPGDPAAGPGPAFAFGRPARRRAGDGALRAASALQGEGLGPEARPSRQPRRGGARRKDPRSHAFRQGAGDDPALFVQRPRAAAEGQGPADGERQPATFWSRRASCFRTAPTPSSKR